MCQAQGLAPGRAATAAGGALPDVATLIEDLRAPVDQTKHDPNRPAAGGDQKRKLGLYTLLTVFAVRTRAHALRGSMGGGEVRGSRATYG